MEPDRVMWLGSTLSQEAPRIAHDGMSADPDGLQIEQSQGSG